MNMYPHAVQAPVQPAPMVAPGNINLDLTSVPLEERRAALEYNDLLGTLTWNSKEIIDNLTKIAAENCDNANGIVFGVEQRILQAQPEAKLPYLYLIDSILKNIGAIYIHKFQPNLLVVFRNVYSNATQHVRSSLHRLLNTWGPLFGDRYVATLRRITIEVDTAPPGANANPNKAQRGQSRIPRVSRPLSLQPNYQNVQANHPTRTRNIVAVPIPKRQVQPQLPLGMANIRASMPMYSHNQAPHVGTSQGMQSAPGSAGIMPFGIAPGYQIRPEGGVQPMNSVPMGMLPPNGNALGFNATLAQAERLMADITRKRALGNVATIDVVALHQLLADQLRCAPPYPMRERFLDIQRRLAAHSNVAPPPLPSVYPPASAHGVVAPSMPMPIPNLSPGALTNLASRLNPLAHTSLGAVNINANGNRNNNPTLNSLSATTAASSLRPPLKFSAIRTTPHAAFVRAIYIDLAHLSKSDAMRFASKEELRKHLDWLFARNRSKHARERNLATGGLSRCWYDAMDVFIGEKTNTNAAEVHNASASTTNKPKVADPMEQCVNAKGEDEICPACQEGFTPFWHEDKQAWMIKEAVRNTKGTIFHARCAASIADIESFEGNLLPSLPTTPVKAERSTLLRGGIGKSTHNNNINTSRRPSVPNLPARCSAKNVKNSSKVLVDAISAEIERRAE